MTIYSGLLKVYYVVVYYACVIMFNRNNAIEKLLIGL